MANRYAKQFKEIERIEKNAKKLKIHNQCCCDHNDDYGEHNLRSVISKDGKNTVAYECKNCGVIIPKKVPTAQEMSDAADVILTCYDYYKMSMLKNHKDSEGNASAELKDIAFVMEEIIKFRAGYKQALENANKKQQNRYGKARRSTITYG